METVVPALAANGTLTYTPANDAFGAATITVTAWDSGGTANGGVPVSDAQNANLTVSAVVDNPADVNVSGNEDSAILGNMDITPDAAYTYVIVSAPSSGVLTPNLSNGSFSYAPNSNFNGSDSFTYRTTAVLGNSAIATVNLDVQPVNDAPAWRGGTALFTNEDAPVSGVTTTTDVDGDVLTYSLVTAATGGDVRVNALTGAFTYYPYHNYSGFDVFYIAASDGFLNSFIPVSVSVSSTDNDAPVAGKYGRAANFVTNVNYYREVNAGTSFAGRVVTAATVEGWFNFATPDGMWGQPGVLFGSEGEFMLWVQGGQLVLKIASNGGADWSSDVATGVYITTGVWTHVAMVYDGSNVMLYVNGVQAYNSPRTGDIVDQSGNNNFWWGNRQDYGYWSFNGQIDDARIWLVARTQVEIAAGMQQEINGGYGLAGMWAFNEISGVAEDITYGNADASLTGSGLGRVANDKNAVLAVSDEDGVASGYLIGRDPDGDTLTYSLFSQPANGTLTLTDVNTGAFTFTPDADWNGTTSFSYSVSDGVLASARATGVITINPMPDDWSAITTTDYTDEDMPIYSGINPEVNIDPLPLNYNVVTAPTNGALYMYTWGYQYYPNQDFFGTDSFVVAIDDGLRTEYGTVNLVIDSVNDAPVMDQPLDVATNDNTLVSGGPLSGSDPVEGSSVTFVVWQQPAGGSVTLSTDTTIFYYTPNHGTSGIDTFYLASNDGSDNSSPRMVQATVTVVNDPPALTSVTPAIVMNEDGTAIINVTGTDPDGDPLRGAVISHPTLGYVTVVGTQITYHAGYNKTGTETLHVTINDYFVNAPTYLPVSVSINGQNDAPVPSAGTIGTSMNQTGTTRVTPHDPENDAVTYSISTQPANGVATVSASGWVSYTPALGFTGEDAMFVQVSDGSLSGTVLVEAVVLPPVSTPTLAQVCAGTNDASVIVMDSPLDGSSLVSGTYTLTGQILYNATYDWGFSEMYTWSPSYYGPVTNANIATGCGSIPFAVPFTFATTGSGYDAYFWFNNSIDDVMFHIDSPNSPTVDILSGTLSYGEMITTSTVDELFVMTYDLNGDTADLNASAYIYGYNLYAERIAVSPDPVTTPVRFRETLSCGTNTYYVEIDANGANSGSAYKYFEYPVQAQALSTYQPLTDFPVNGEDVHTYVYVDSCSTSGVVHVTSTDPAFAVLTTDVTLGNQIELVYRGSLLLPGEKREGFLVFTSEEGDVLNRLPISAISHDFDFSALTPVQIYQMGNVSLALPFEFPVDGTFYSQIELNDRSVFSFGQSIGSTSWPYYYLGYRPVDGSLSAIGLAQGFPIIAPFWGSDHYFQWPGNELSDEDIPADIYYRNVPDANGGHFELLYWDLNDGNTYARFVFRVNLYPDGRIQVIYDQLTAIGFEQSGYISSAGDADLYPVYPINDGTVRWFGPY